MMENTKFVAAACIAILVHAALGAFAIGNSSVKCIESERLALLSLKHGFVDLEGSLSSWGNAMNQTECCHWDGVSCDDQTSHVSGLVLENYNLEGTISPSLADLHHLIALNLAYNTFNLTQFPSFIFSLKELERLDLSFTNLKGKIPHELGDLLRLRELYLAGNNLEGEIPKSLALCSLHRLDLRENNLSGQLDDFVASFSHCASISLEVLDLTLNQFEGPLPNFSQFSSLKYLFMDYNQLNGTLNDSIGLLSNLSELSISCNSLQGAITETHFLELSQLQRMDLSFNHLVFQVSPDWIPPFQLSSIYLASCKLGPRFPTWLRTQKPLYGLELDISNAEVSGPIPNWFWDFQFNYLNLSHNQFTGQIPKFQSRDEFALVDFSSNLFEGSIPSNLSNAEHSLLLSNNKFTDASSLLCPTSTTILEELDLSDNQLFGLLPDCWKNFGNLIFLNIANNSFFGKIPPSLGSLGKLEALHLGNNRFGGEIPFVLSKCKVMSTFDVAKNNLSGLIPTWIGDQLKKLRILSLRSNMFFGSLPHNICHLSQIQILDLSMNNISGSLPKCLNHLSTLANKTNPDVAIIYDSTPVEAQAGRRFVDIIESSIIVWKGKEEKYRSILGLVKSIDFSSNKLTGEIPSEVMDLVGLVSLNISRNKISGQIPAAIGQLESLDFLDLSRNHLFGNIPSELARLDRLSVLDLSYNDLVGEIPVGTQLQSFDPSTYAGNAELCGAPLPKCPSKPIDHNQSEGNSKDDGGQLFNRGFYISLSVGFNTGFWGVCNLLFLNKSWRYAYFKFMNDAYDEVYVVVAVNMAKLSRNRVST